MSLHTNDDLEYACVYNCCKLETDKQDHSDTPHLVSDADLEGLNALKVGMI